MKYWIRNLLHTFLILGFILDPNAVLALELEIRANYNLRHLQNNEMMIVGMIAAGSVVEVPDEFKKIDAHGNIDTEETLKTWVDAHTNAATAGEYNYKDVLNNPGKEKFFQVKITKAAPGSRIPKDQENFFIALDHARRHGHLFTMDKDTKIMRHQDTPSKEVTAGCDGECKTSTPKTTLTSAASEIIQKMTLPKAEARENGEIQPLLSDLAKGCNNFISTSGEIGPWGQFLIKKANENNLFKYKLFNDNDNLCPRYDKMSSEEKENAFLWAMTALSNEESSCVPRAASPVVSSYIGRGIGLFQMEEKESVRERRGKACDGDMMNPYSNISCSMSIMGKLVLSQNNGLMTRKDNYWGPLSLPYRYDNKNKEWFSNPAYNHFRAHMKKFKACYEGA